VNPKAQGRINSLYMTATFFGGALGVTISGWLMARYGWTGIVAFGGSPCWCTGREARERKYDPSRMPALQPSDGRINATNNGADLRKPSLPCDV